MKGQKLPLEDHIVRFVSPSRLRRDENNAVVGILPTAFELRPEDEGLSVTWLEYFAGDRDQKIASTIRAIRASAIKVSQNSGFAIGNVGAIANTVADRGYKIRIIHMPVGDNKAHAEIRQFPRNELELLERLAATVWSEFVLNTHVPPGAESAPDKSE